MTATWYPFHFKPVYQDYMWGGDRIIRTFEREEPPGVYAESWEVSDRDEGLSRVANGPRAGDSLLDLLRADATALLGAGREADRFPLLIKLIDARRCLSVQVHPDDEAAAQSGGEAKTEMWYVLDADEGAGVYAGLLPGVGPEELKEALERGAAPEVLRRIDVAAGDVIFIPGGRVHAIDAGCLLLEVQQNSNSTYRLYDWDRVGANGRPRPLHREQALQVIRWNDTEDPRVTPRPMAAEGPCERMQLLACAYFRLEGWCCKARVPWPAPGCWQVWFLARGSGRLTAAGQALELTAGTSVLVPAACPDALFEPSGRAELLRVTPP